MQIAKGKISTAVVNTVCRARYVPKFRKFWNSLSARYQEFRIKDHIPIVHSATVYEELPNAL